VFWQWVVAAWLEISEQGSRETGSSADLCSQISLRPVRQLEHAQLTFLLQ